MSEIRTFFRHCPACGRRFEIRLVGKELEDSEAFEEEARPARAATPASVMGRSIVVPTLVGQDKPTLVDVEEFQYAYKCKHCGHEWTEVRNVTESSAAPTGYTGD